MSEDVDTVEVKRVTLAFSKTEDRISLTCMLIDDAVAVLWLTARLARQLVPHLLSLIGELPQAHRLAGSTAARNVFRETPEVVDANPPAEFNGFAETRASKAPVVAEAGSASWVVSAIDVTNGPMMVRLHFRDEQRQLSALMLLEHTQLAVWLDGLKQCYVQAGWSQECWQLPTCSEPNRLTAQRVLMH